MVYQIVFKSSALFKILLTFSIVNCALSIVNRDLVLTPKQGLQLSGKRIYYDENANTDATPSPIGKSNSSREAAAAAAARPWERTLKHVTYLTLFTNAPNGIITGNFSKVREYNEFLQSPYVHSPKPLDSRFGDIVTLAQGRLESLANGTYRFVEGNCDYACARENKMVATWHVQKIRHRDIDRKFHYEIKFSVSPMTGATPSETVVRGGPNKRTAIDSNNGQHHQHKLNNIQTFIQKEDDYPHSFSKLKSATYEQDDDFVDRRYDGSRNTRQFNPDHGPQQQQHHHSQITPMPQSTFLRGIHRPPPVSAVQHPHSYLINQGPPPPEQLNIGEYYKGSYGPKASPKIELFPNLLTMMFGKPHIYPKHPSTFRPHVGVVEQQLHFSRPETYTAPAVAAASPPNIPQPSYTQQHHHQEYTPASGHFIHNQEYAKIPEYYQSHEHITSSKEVLSPVITHHYHHHFFMTNSSDSGEQHSGDIHVSAVNRGGGGGGGAGVGAQDQNLHPNSLYKTNVQIVTPQPEQAAPVTPVTNEEHKPHIVLAQQITQQQYQLQQQQQNQQKYQEHLQQQQQQHLHFPTTPPAPQKFVFPIGEIEQHRVVHVTPVPPLRKPQYQQQQYHYYTQPYVQHQQQYAQQHHVQQQYVQPHVQQQYTAAHPPTVIYPAPIEEDTVDIPTPRSKPFIQSQPMDEEPIRYSEPDPLYANVDGNHEDQVTYVPTPEESQEPQLEEPQHYEAQSFPEAEKTPDDTTKQHSESIEAQVPAPHQHNYNLQNSYETSRHDEEVDNDNEADNEEGHEVSTQQTADERLEQNTSHSTTTIKISTTDNNIETESEANGEEATIAVTTKQPKPLNARAKRVRVKVTKLTSSTTGKPKLFSTRVTTEKELQATTPMATTNSAANSTKEPKQFVSTSTTETPLKSLSRYRHTNKRLTFTTTTTEKPVLKWKPRRKEATGKALSLKNIGKQTTTSSLSTQQQNQATIREVTKAENNPSLQHSTTEKQPENTLDDVLLLDTDPNSTSTTMSSLNVEATLPPSTTSVSETYEVLTQKSISYKVGEDGPEIPLIINDSDNEVKKSL
ncbi:uncharacterized protein [Musca autumnalis]|uniref:uncharacterized protein n=1 Tax=Musca autumnalis TaxID=221902 RepID=UPI003CEB13AC